MNTLLLSIFLLGTPVPSSSRTIHAVSFKDTTILVYSREKIKQTIEKFAVIHNISPEEMFAIAYIESRFNPEAVSSTGDYGLFQINCAIWWKTLGFLSKTHCKEVQTTYYPASILDAIFIVKHYRKHYPQCARQNVFACYNGGMGYAKSPLRRRAEHYRKRVKETYEKFIAY